MALKQYHDITEKCIFHLFLMITIFQPIGMLIKLWASALGDKYRCVSSFLQIKEFSD